MQSKAHTAGFRYILPVPSFASPLTLLLEVLLAMAETISSSTKSPTVSSKHVVQTDQSCVNKCASAAAAEQLIGGYVPPINLLNHVIATSHTCAFRKIEAPKTERSRLHLRGSSKFLHHSNLEEVLSRSSSSAASLLEVI